MLDLSKGTIIIANEDCYDMANRYIPAGTSLKIVDTAIMDHYDFVWFVACDEKNYFSIPCSYSKFFSPACENIETTNKRSCSTILYYKFFITICFIAFCLFMLLSFIL